MTREEHKRLCEQLDALGQAFAYLSGTFIVTHDGEDLRLEYHKPIENARYCLQFAEAIPLTRQQ